MPETLERKTSHYPEHGKYSFLNLTLSVWLKESIAQFNKEDKKDKVSRYSKMDPDGMIMEPPVLFGSGYVTTNVLDRVGGLLMLDRKIRLVSFDEFLAYAHQSDKVENTLKDQSPFNEVIQETTQWSELLSTLTTIDQFSSTTVCWLTKDINDQSYQIIIDCSEGNFDFDLFVEWVFNGYSFESIKLDLPLTPSGTSGFSDASCGTVVVSDRLLVGNAITINVIDLNSVKKIIG